VLAANRKPGGFSAFGGLVTKERLLGLEGVRLVPELPLFAGLQSAAFNSSADSRS
jgi:methylated-DNA-[protein]-cysteine S-methyltransferase